MTNSGLNILATVDGKKDYYIGVVRLTQPDVHYVLTFMCEYEYAGLQPLVQLGRIHVREHENGLAVFFVAGSEAVFTNTILDYISQILQDVRNKEELMRSANFAPPPNSVQ